MNTKLLTLSAIAAASTLSLTLSADENYAPSGYSIETVTTPDDVLFHITGLDTAADGTVYCATRFGDVWTYKNDSWTKFADGLHEPTGLLVDEDGSILVAQKPELTRLVDSDSDGIADRYISFSDGWEYHDNYHEFTFGPVRDKDGNYFGTLNLSHNDPDAFSLGAMGTSGGYRGFAFKVSPDGTFSPYAHGLRSPAGVGISPNNEIFFTDNQGDWVATSKLHIIEEGKFYGHPVSLIQIDGYDRKKIAAMEPEEFNPFREKPVLWIPHQEVANSPGNPEWDMTKGKFGPFSGQIFIGDQTQSNIFRCGLEKVNGQYQGFLINFMSGFQSGNIRLDFDSQGQLWVGQTARGWGAKGNKPFGLEKVVWDGTHPFELLDMKLTKKGFQLTFTQPVNPNSIDAESLVFEKWGYNYWGNYGSPKVDETPVAVKSVKLKKGNTVIDVQLDLQTDQVFSVKFPSVKNKDGHSPSVTQAYYTLNELK
ncbi:DUF7133 domain-containing protein [Pelagicoccus mobilis]|uniref:DUF7133 domain-containing protein n=1 Tax=Pelagicoccus mobilis TaxID=415221 RepID=A0A934RZ22_9BACT|nr:hypothetical protein [Pelagicoccus mobilis]MBK1878145.1 hypothetical protein [Pelagicoccus mobilis]